LFGIVVTREHYICQSTLGGVENMKLKFAVQASSENPTKTVVKARDFQIVIDEPKNMGGTDHGPNPVEYVLGAHHRSGR
jgi:hypothetical protein